MHAGIAAAADEAQVSKKVHHNCSLPLLDGRLEYVNWHPDPSRNAEWCQRVGVDRQGHLSFAVPWPGTSSDWRYVAESHIVMQDIGIRMWKTRCAH